jgi:hypothetical protein
MLIQTPIMQSSDKISLTSSELLSCCTRQSFLDSRRILEHCVTQALYDYHTISLPSITPLIAGQSIRRTEINHTRVTSPKTRHVTSLAIVYDPGFRIYPAFLRVWNRYGGDAVRKGSRMYFSIDSPFPQT